MAPFTLCDFIMEPITFNILSFLPFGVMFHHKRSFALNTVAHSMVLRMSAGKTHTGFRGHDASFNLWPLLTQEAVGDG